MTTINPVINYSNNVFQKINDPVGSNIGEHGRRVALMLEFYFIKYGFNPLSDKDCLKIIFAALTHDVLEDTSESESSLKNIVGNEPLSIVKELTISFENKNVVEAVAPLENISLDAYLIKMSDMLDTADKTKFYIKTNGIEWYENFYFPLAREYQRLNKIFLKKMTNYKFLKIAIDLSVLFDDRLKTLNFFVRNY